MTTIHRLFPALLMLAVLAAGCDSPATSVDPPNTAVQPAGPDTTLPFPIDRGDDNNTPGTYKGLWLRLKESTPPTVTAVDGVIGVVCVGMSNSSQECADFIQRLAGEYAAQVNPAVKVVNCAVGGHAIERWIDPSYDATLWDDCTGRRLPQAGVRPDQVRVLYHKAANQLTSAQGGGALPTYPTAGSDYENFRQNLSAFAARVKAKLPTVQAVYTSTRTYGGYSGGTSRGEPLSYEEGHALNSWLAENPLVDGVTHAWGPYLWAPACSTGVSNKGGVCYDRADFVADGVHPSASGTAKVSGLIQARLLRESWYRR